jgi:peptidoglycan hydrolase CwlO-like protein
MRKSYFVGLIVIVALCISLAACQDTKAKQENEQLKAQVSSLQKDVTDQRAQIEQLTVARDGLARENESLKTEIESLKSKRPGAKAPKAPQK